MSKNLIIVFGLIGITLIVYLPVTQNAFINFDDGMYVFANPNVKSSSPLTNMYWPWTTFYAANWHPLTWLSHMLDYQLFGLHAGGHHLTSLLWHLAGTVLLFLVFNTMTGRLWPSSFIAAAFAVHPLHVESVAWVAERKDVLCAFFWILTMGAYIHYVKSPNKRVYFLVLFTFLLGLMSKPMMVTLPFVLLLLDYWPLQRVMFSFRRNQPKTQEENGSFPKVPFLVLIVEKIPFFIFSALSSAVTYYAQKSAGAVNQLVPLSIRISNALISYVGYLSKMVWPTSLAVFYPYPMNRPGWQIVCAGLILILFTIGVFWKGRRYPYLITGWLWFLGTLVPVIGLVQVGIQSMADRYTYLPSIGIFLILAWGLPDLLAHRPGRRIVLPFIAALSLVLLMGLTRVQVGYWRTSFSLFQHAIDVTSGNFKAHDMLGFTYMEQGNLDQAIDHFQEAIRMNPKYVSAYNNLGVAFERKGRDDQALTWYLSALRVMPGFPEAHYNLGSLMARQGKLGAAISHFRAALKENPEYAEAYNNLGLVLQLQGKVDESITLYGKALAIKPLYADAHYNLGNALAIKGRLDEAIEHFITTLRIDPEYAVAANNLGLAQFRKGMVKEAIISFRKALTINPHLEVAKNNLDNVLKESGTGGPPPR